MNTSFSLLVAINHRAWCCCRVVRSRWLQLETVCCFKSFTIIINILLSRHATCYLKHRRDVAWSRWWRDLLPMAIIISSYQENNIIIIIILKLNKKYQCTCTCTCRYLVIPFSGRFRNLPIFVLSLTFFTKGWKLDSCC